MKFTAENLCELNVTLAKVIAEGLKKYKQMNRDTYPPFIGGEYVGENCEKEEEFVDKWEDILDQMIWSFDQIANDCQDSPINQSMEAARDANRSVYDLSDALLQKQMEYKSRIQMGLDLFAKYFENLMN